VDLGLGNDTCPGLQAGDDTGPGLRAGNDTGPGLQAGNDTGPGLRAGNYTGPGLWAGNDTGSGLRAGIPQRTCGVGASIPDLSQTTADTTSSSKTSFSSDTIKIFNDIPNDMTGIPSEGTGTVPTNIVNVPKSVQRCRALPHTAAHHHRRSTNEYSLPQRGAPVGAACPDPPRVVRSADSSPSPNRRFTLTQYGFVDDISGLNNAIIGLSEEHLLEIAASKPDRINARIRRQNRRRRLDNSQ